MNIYFMYIDQFQFTNKAVDYCRKILLRLLVGLTSHLSMGEQQMKDER